MNYLRAGNVHNLGLQPGSHRKIRNAPICLEENEIKQEAAIIYRAPSSLWLVSFGGTPVY